MRKLLGWPIRLLRRSLWFRLAASFGLVLLLLSGAILSAVGRITTREFGQYVDERNRYIETMLPTVAPPPMVTRIAPRLPETAEVDPGVAQPEMPPLVTESGITFSPRVLETVRLFETETQGLSFLRDVRQGVQVAIVAAAIAAIFLVTLLSRQITRPLGQLRRATQALAGGDLAARVPVKGEDEVGKVGAAFNQMATQIEAQETLRRQMVADVAHELRTPVTVIRSDLEAMLDGLLPPSPEELGALHGEVERLSRMIEDLRLLSLADAGQISLVPAILDVRAVVGHVVERLATRARAADVTLRTDLPADVLPVRGDADRLQQALGNLLDNAVRHTPSGGNVRVTAVLEKETVHVTVADSGPGIPADDLPYIFERFWRGDKSRSRYSGGSGLGLSIARQIASLHGGTLQVVSPPGSGAIFTLSLPVAPEKDDA
jgi:signal transduction histidine kinase